VVADPETKRAAIIDPVLDFDPKSGATATHSADALLEHLQRLFDEFPTTPAVNQIELHPLLQQEEMRKVHVTHRIVTEAWSPLAQGALLNRSEITGLADKYAKTPAQIVLRWHVQLGNVVIPKSVTPYRIKENIDIFDFELAQDDMTVIAELDNGTRTGPDPDRFNVA
jgi:diketogulonate reductase-like aldo/keto reductase